jgi:CheY-like chemotaxis protein
MNPTRFVPSEGKSDPWILIAVTNQDLALRLQELLHRAGFPYHAVASGGKACLAGKRQDRPTWQILSSQLPDMSSQSLYEQLPLLDHGLPVPTLFLEPFPLPPETDGARRVLRIAPLCDPERILTAASTLLAPIQP